MIWLKSHIAKILFGTLEDPNHVTNDGFDCGDYAMIIST